MMDPRDPKTAPIFFAAMEEAAHPRDDVRAPQGCGGCLLVVVIAIVVFVGSVVLSR